MGMGVRRSARRLASALALVVTAGCVGRTAFSDTVLDYDDSVSRAQARMLLLNIARAHHRRPLHFTTVSGIAATFDFETQATVAGELSESPGLSLFLPSFGLRFSENPTLNIVPIQGEEFTRRLLTPLDESVLGFFYHQGVDMALLLSLIAHGIVVEEPNGERRLLGNDPEGKEEFDQQIEKLAALNRNRRIDVGALILEENWALEGSQNPDPLSLAQLIEQGFDYRRDQKETRLQRRTLGRQVLTNYDPATLSSHQRTELQQQAQDYPSSFVLVDIKTTSPESSWRGWIKLRSLSSILDATASAVNSPTENAKFPLRVVRDEDAPDDSLFQVRYENAAFFLPNDGEGQNATAFRILYRLYQMTVSPIPGNAVPAVTIAK